MLRGTDQQRHVNNITTTATTPMATTVAATMTTLAGQVFFYLIFIYSTNKIFT